MAQPIFSDQEISDFNEKLKTIRNDTVNFPEYKDKENATRVLRNAYFTKAVSRIRKNRMEDFLNFLLVIVGTKGEAGDIRFWKWFVGCDGEEYSNLLEICNTPHNNRFVHMFLKAVLFAHRNWALTAFVKFLRGNKVAGGKADKLEGYGDFHKDSGWTELQVKNVAEVLFDERSEVSKLFMQYDADLTDRVHEESKTNWDIPYSAQFAATSKIVNKEFLQELIALLEKRELAPKPTDPKKKAGPHVAKVFKPGDVIKKNAIADIPPLSLIEIKVKMRMKAEDTTNTPGTIQIVLVKPPEPRHYLNIWRIVGDKAYLPESVYDFDRERSCLENAVYKGPWEKGVQAQEDRYKYPHNYIGI